MAADAKQRLRNATVVYWVLLLYIMAALGWWAFSLLRQNNEIHELRKATVGAAGTDRSAQVQAINQSQRRGVYKYIGEGAAFLLFISVGAVFIYRSVRRQVRQQQQEQNFVMAITHELKTPLAVARLNLETLQKRQLEEETRTKLLQTALQETLRLDTLINNILIASQLEGHAYRTVKDDLDFSGLVRDGLKAFGARYPERPLKVDVQDDVTLHGDATLLKLLLSNLLENANKYSPKGKVIAVSLMTETDYADEEAANVTLLVADEGPGIPDGEKRAVFQKFYRMGDEQTRKAQGTGLGLYICQRIAADHKGSITVVDNAPAGSRFVVQF